MGHRLADLFHGRRRLQVGALLAGPVGWLVIGYLGSLALLLVAAFWSVDPLSGATVKNFTLENFESLVNEPVYRTIVWRTIRTALLVTLTDGLTLAWLADRDDAAATRAIDNAADAVAAFAREGAVA